MKQPSVYSMDQIIDAAYELIREKGWEGVTTRAIAKRMGSSTMPIYSRVRSVSELEGELQKKARQLLKEYQQRDYTEHILLNLAVGYITFARDEKYLFRFLYLERPEEIHMENRSEMRAAFLSEFGDESPQGRALRELKESGQEALVQYTWIFTHGLAMLANSGAFGPASDAVILGLLKDAGEAFYTWSISKGEGFSPEEGLS